MEYVCIVAVSPFMTRPEGSYDQLDRNDRRFDCGGVRLGTQLYAHLTSHVEGERALLQEYRAAAQTTPSKALRYLVNLLIDDEIRHHRIFMQLTDSLRNDSMLGGKNPCVPHLDFDRESNRDAVIDLTDQLLRKEQEDAQGLKHLKREAHDVKDTSL